MPPKICYLIQKGRKTGATKAEKLLQPAKHKKGYTVMGMFIAKRLAKSKGFIEKWR
jgi:hypothetical protein